MLTTARCPAALLLLSALLRPVAAQAPLQMAITFDDLPAHGEHPPAVSRLDIIHSILGTLRAEHMPPTYGFVNGVHTQTDPPTLAVLQAWRAAGQPLGNHTWSHPEFNKIDVTAFEQEIARNEPLLRSLTASPPQQDWHWFRYPYLQEGDTLAKHRAARGWLKQHDYRVAEVTMDFEDYLWNAPYTRCTAKGDTAAIAELERSYLATAAAFIDVYRTLAHEVWGREIAYILLLHVGAFDAHMLPRLLALYRSHGFEFVELPQAAADPIYAEDPDFAYSGGDSLTERLATRRNLDMPAASKPYRELAGMCR